MAELADTFAGRRVGISEEFPDGGEWAFDLVGARSDLGYVNNLASWRGQSRTGGLSVGEAFAQFPLGLDV